MNEPLLFALPNHVDARGRLVKPYAAEVFARELPFFSFKEIFFSVNKLNVLRGFHFQRPPLDHAKVVFVLEGQILDVLLDLRPSSQRYGVPVPYVLTAADPKAIYVPRGFAHAFLSQSENSVVGYLQETERVADAESGLAWNSVGFNWPAPEPLLSDRDQVLPAFADFRSPWN